MHTKPHWFDTDLPIHPPLRKDIETGVLVVGGGITGITAAFLLQKAGMDVTLLERDSFAERDTGHTTAHLTYMTDTRLSELCRKCGPESARLAWEAGRAAMDLIREQVESLSIDCDLVEVPGYLAAHDPAAADDEWKRLRKEGRMAREMGFEVEFIESDPVRGLPALRFPDQMKFHPRKYLNGLLDEAERLGLRAYERSEVSAFKKDHAEANGHRIGFDQVVIATHVPLQGLAGTVGAAMFQTKLALYSSYAIAARLPHGRIEELIWSDTAEPFNYLRIERGHDEDLAIFGGEDHKTGQANHTSERFEALEGRLAELLPGSFVTERWSGQVIETNDGLPYIGRICERQFIATGFSGNGMTLGTAAAMMARDAILKHANPWAECFDPSRKVWSAVGDYVRENADFPGHLVCDRIGIPSETPEDLMPGCGKVVRWGHEIVAAFRDETGALHLSNAVCPHMGCIFAWNGAERTWDCPCHGSRFRATGAVMGGPAERGLKAIEAAAQP